MKDFLGNQQKWKASLKAQGMPINFPSSSISNYEKYLYCFLGY